MRRVAAALTFSGATFAGATAGGPLPGGGTVDDACAATAGARTDLSVAGTIVVDARLRSFIANVPGHRAGARLPVVFAFHGRGETPESLARYSALSRLRAVVVYPRGLPGRGGKLSWSGTPAATSTVDDVRFVLATLERLERAACVAPGRAAATGKSDGGGLAAQLACAAARRFGAVAPVAGAYYPIPGGCRPARPVAVLEMHGTADRVIPYRGLARRGLPAVEAWLAGWARRDGCAAAQPPQHVGAGATLRLWERCRGRVRVAGIRIADGGHTWPGARAPSGPGYVSQAIDATNVIAAFFGVYALPRAAGRSRASPAPIFTGSGNLSGASH